MSGNPNLEYYTIMAKQITLTERVQAEKEPAETEERRRERGKERKKDKKIRKNTGKKEKEIKREFRKKNIQRPCTCSAN